MMKKLLLATVAFAMLPFVLSAQKPAETKLFNKAVADATVKSYDKFLSKYPESVYAPVIKGKRDTLLHVSPYSITEASVIAGQYIKEQNGYVAFAWRDEGQDKITAFRILAKGLGNGEIRISDFRKKADSWVPGDEATYPYSDYSESDAERTIAENAEIVRIGGSEYFHLTVTSTSKDGRSVIVPILYNPRTQGLHSITAICQKPRNGKTEYRIVNMETPRAEEDWLTGRIARNENLVEMSNADYKTIEAFRHWEEQNPDALTKATKISAVILPADCSLVEEFKTVKKKESSKLYKAAMFDFRDYTVIVAYESKTGNFVLEWMEPICTDSRTQRLLNSISFTSGTTIEMFYYQGNRTFKYLLNLSSKTLRR